MATFITRLDPPSVQSGPRLAVKDLIDVVGVPTTSGCKALVDAGPGARPARSDASCLAGARAAMARIVGKTNLHELAYGAIGSNPWFGTPVNPLGSGLVPGGSSSGSAVAVATDEADIAYGSDTGGSVRIPAACCGVVGLKTSFGRISTQGCRPLAQSVDTIGPLARDMAGLVLGMQLLEPGFEPVADFDGCVGRLRGHPADDAAVDRAVDAALARTGWEVVDVVLAGWADANAAGRLISMFEAAANWSYLLVDHADGVAADVAERLASGAVVDSAHHRAALAVMARWQAELAELFGRVSVLALPTLPVLPPSFEQADLHVSLTSLTRPFNIGHVPALSMPVPVPFEGSGVRLPASLQLVGPLGSEERLVAAAAVVEAAVG